MIMLLNVLGWLKMDLSAILTASLDTLELALVAGRIVLQASLILVCLARNLLAMGEDQGMPCGTRRSARGTVTMDVRNTGHSTIQSADQGITMWDAVFVHQIAQVVLEMTVHTVQRTLTIEGLESL